MNIKELKNKTVKDLQNLLASHRERLRALRFKVTNKQLSNVREIRLTKKLIARLLTLLNKKNSKSRGPVVK